MQMNQVFHLSSLSIAAAMRYVPFLINLLLKYVQLILWLLLSLFQKGVCVCIEMKLL